MVELGHETTSAVREHVVVMFADLCDYTAISEASDPEDVGELRQGLEALAASVIQSHGGTITQVYGDGFLALFGYPRSQEDDARHAVEAALQLHKVVRAARWPRIAGSEVRLHTGIHGGLVLVRTGDAVRGRYDLTGDVVNTAARLSAAAGRDEILVSAAVLGGIEGFFELEELPLELPLKGKKQPVPAYRLSHRSSAGTRYEARSRRGLTGFVGRATVMAELVSAVQEASAGHLTLSVVTGAAGIGKSRVLEELRNRVAARASVLWGTCESFGEMVPLEPFRQVLKQALGLSELSPEELSARLPEALAALGLAQADEVLPVVGLFSLDRDTRLPDGGEVAPLMVATLSKIIGALCQHTTVVLLLDDWQWADDTSRNVLDQVLRDHRGCALSVVVAARALDFVHPQLSHARVLALEPFQEDESAQVILALRPRELQLGVTRAIHRRAGGNPLFVEELCRSLPPHALADEESLEQFDAPTTLQGAIKARVSSLPKPHVYVLCAASVIGMEFSLTLLSWVIQSEDLPDLLAYLMGSDLIYQVKDGTFRFKHGIARNVVYESVLLAERRRIHTILAQGYTNSTRPEHLSSQAEALAYHYRGSGDHERAVQYAELAGDRAMQTNAMDRARHHYSAALHSLENLPASDELKRRMLRLSIHWAQACVYSPARDQLAHLERAAHYADELGESGAQAQAQYMLGWIRYVLGDSAEAIRHYQAALALAVAAGDERLMAQLWANLGQSYAAAGQNQPALEHLDRAIAHKRARPPRPGQQIPQGFAYALGCRAATLSYMGRFAEAERDLQEALPLVRGSGHPVEGSVQALSAMVELHRGCWEPCLDAARRGRMVAERGNSAYVLATSSTYEAYAHFKLSRSEASLRRLQLAVDFLVDQGIGLFISLAHACVADALMEWGDAGGAEAAARRALERAAHADPLGELMALRTLARLYGSGSGSDPARAEQALCDAFARADAHQSARERALTQLAAAELAREPSALLGLREPLTRALETLEAMGMTMYARRAQALVQRMDGMQTRSQSRS